MKKFARWLVHLYPGEWRERYEEEFVATLEESPATFAVLLDVALGALDARVRPQVSDRRLRMVVRLRGSVLAVLWGWVGIVVAGVGFQKMTEYDDFVRAARESVWVGFSFDAVVAGAILALVSVLAGGLPVALTALQGAITEGRRDVPLLFCAPLACLGLFVGYVLLVTKVVYPEIHPIGLHSPLNVAIFLSIAGAFVLAAVASVWAISAAVYRAELDEAPLRFALYPAASAALAMGVVLVGTLAWGLALRARTPGLFTGDGGILSTNTAATWVAILAVMAVSTVVAVHAVVRGFSARGVD